MMYLVPTKFIEGSDVPIEYKLWDIDRDMRKSWCRQHDNENINFNVFCLFSDFYKMRLTAHVNGIRVTAPSKEAAKMFYEDIHREAIDLDKEYRCTDSRIKTQG